MLNNFSPNNFVLDNFALENPIGQGKTKAVYASKIDPSLVLIRSFDSITAFNAKRKDELTGKAVAATQTTCNIFKFLNAAGCKTHFVTELNDTDFVAEKCEMIPIEWVARRIATGSFLKRNPGVLEGETFSTPKIETFFKDDANDDPQYSDEQILGKKFEFVNGHRKIGKNEILIMKRWTSAIFKILEKAWLLQNCVLVDMKIEFGFNRNGNILLADVIDNDSWRVWPGGDKRLQLDKQFYRDLPTVTESALIELKKNYERVAEITNTFNKVHNKLSSRLVIFMGSPVDLSYTEKIVNTAHLFGIKNVIKRICSAHKSTAEVLCLLNEYEGDTSTVIIAVAGRSNGLGPVISSNTTLPVINSPPLVAEWADKDVWSSFRMPTGVGCTTVFGPEEAALAAAKILGLTNYFIFAKILASQTINAVNILESDTKMQNLIELISS